jgi:hypothetical protein
MEKAEFKYPGKTFRVREFLKECIRLLYTDGLTIQREVFVPVSNGRSLYNPLKGQNVMQHPILTSRFPEAER